MRYLVDANVLSETTRRAPDAQVVRWMEDHEPELVVSSVVLAELAVGVEALPEGRKRRRLVDWFEALVETVECLAWDASAAREWARLVVELRRRGRTMPLLDSMIAAAARAHGLVVVTRNVRDFAEAGVELLDPWSAGDRPPSVHERQVPYGA